MRILAEKEGGTCNGVFGLVKIISASEGDSALNSVLNAEKNSSITTMGNGLLQVFGSVYNLLIVVGVFAGLIGLVLGFVELSFAKKGRLREVARGRLASASLTLILTGGAVALVNIFLSLAG